MSLTRRLALGLAGAALAPGAFAASSPAKPAAAHPASAACGAALPLSGGDALLGSEVLRGIQLAAEAVNAAGGIAGRPVTLLAADMPDPASATAAVNGLINAGHAGVMLGSGTSGLCYPASAAAELAQVPFIELTAPADGICTRGFKYLLRTGPTTQMAAALAVATLQARFAGRRLGLLYNIGATGGAFAAAMIAALAAAKLPVTLAAGYPEGVEDLHDEAGRLMRAKVEVLVHAAGLDDALGLALACKMQGWQPQVLLGYGAGYEYRENAAALPAAGATAYVIAAPFYPAAAAAVQAAYMARFGMAPRAADSLTAYAGAKLLFDTLGKVDGDPARLLAALRQTNLPPGSLANGFGVAFDRNGQNSRAFVTLQQWRGGVPVPVAAA